MMKMSVAALAFGAMLPLAAQAQETAPPPPPPVPGETAPATAPMGGEMAPAAHATHGGMPPITGARAGGVAIWGDLQINMSKELVGKPFSIAPDIIYGVSDVLSVALIHSTWGYAGLAGGVGDGLCLAGKKNGCAKVYNAVGAQARYAFTPELALDLGVFASSLSDPMLADAKIGIAGKVMAGPLMLMFEPNIHIGLNKRDAGNIKQLVVVPVCVGLPLNEQLMAMLQTGIYGMTEKFGDNYRIPLSLGAMFHLNPNTMLGAMFTFNNIGGKKAPGVGAADERALELVVGWMN